MMRTGEEIVQPIIDRPGGLSCATMLILWECMERKPPTQVILGGPGKETRLRLKKLPSKYASQNAHLGLGQVVDNAKPHTTFVLMSYQAGEPVARLPLARANRHPRADDMILWSMIANTRFGVMQTLKEEDGLQYFLETQVVLISEIQAGTSIKLKE